MANTKDTSIFRGRPWETHGKKDLTGATAAYTLGTDEAMYHLVEFFGAITADKTITFPAVDGLQWVIANNCTGANILTVKLEGGAKSITVAQGTIQPLYSDGAELYPLAGCGNQAGASSAPGELIGFSTSPSFAAVAIDSGATSKVLTAAQASGFFIEFHNAHNGVVTVQFPATEGRFWVIRNAADSLFAVRCFAAGTPATFVDVNPSYDGFIVVDDALTMTQVLVKHGNTHASAGSDPITNALNLTAIPNLPASQITSGQVALAQGGTNADLSATGGTTKVLAQAANHVVSARDLVAGDIPSLAASILTSGTLETARLRRGTQITLCAGFTPAGTGADTLELLVPYDPADGTTSITWNVRRISLRVRVAGGAPVAVVEKSSAGDAAFGSATTVGTLTMVSGHNLVSVTAALGTVASGDLIRFNVTTLGTATEWLIIMELGS